MATIGDLDATPPSETEPGVPRCSCTRGCDCGIHEGQATRECPEPAFPGDPEGRCAWCISGHDRNAPGAHSLTWPDVTRYYRRPRGRGF